MVGIAVVESFLIKGFYESHIHSGFDIVGSCGDDIDMITGARDAGLAGIVIKNHVFPTGARARIAEKGGAMRTAHLGGLVLGVLSTWQSEKAQRGSS